MLHQGFSGGGSDGLKHDSVRVVADFVGARGNAEFAIRPIVRGRDRRLALRGAFWGVVRQAGGDAGDPGGGEG